MMIPFGIRGKCMGFSEKLYEFLEEKSALRGWQAEFAQRSGISQSAFSKILSKKTKEPELSSIGAIVDTLGDEFLVSLLENKTAIRRLAPNAPTEIVEGEGLQELSVYDVAGAGPAIEVSELRPLFSVYAPPDYLRRADYAIMVDGHSMEPLIPNKSVVGIKTDAPFVANELYAARIPYEGMVIKRVGVDRATNEFVFKSQNPDKESYPDFRVNIDEAEKIIVGRVVWVMWGY